MQSLAAHRGTNPTFSSNEKGLGEEVYGGELMHWFYKGWTRSHKKTPVRIGQQKSNSCFSFLMVAVKVSRPDLIGSMLLQSSLLVTKVVKVSGIY